MPVATAPSSRACASPFSGCPFSADINGPFPPRPTTQRTTNRIALFAVSYVYFIARFAQMYARSSDFSSILLLQPPADLPECPRPVRVLMLVLTHLGVREMAPFRDEDRSHPNPPSPSARARSPPRPLPEDTYLRPRDRGRADGARRAVLAGEHRQDALVADAREEPLGQRTRQAVPGPDDEPRVLDEDRIR